MQSIYLYVQRQKFNCHQKKQLHEYQNAQQNIINSQLSTVISQVLIVFPEI